MDGGRMDGVVMQIPRGLATTQTFVLSINNVLHVLV